jgi:acetolactate synthase-1/3 small subunit
MEHLHTISVFTENSPGVLHRITVLFTRRKLNIESLTVSETERKGISRFTIVIRADDDILQKVLKQIARIVEVLDVSAKPNEELLFKEIAFYRVLAATPDKRSQIEDLSRRYNSTIVHLGESSLVIEKTGNEEEVNSLYLLLEPYGIKEFVRSGRIAIAKDL